MLNILVTGATGQLGSEIKHLVDNSFFKMDPRLKTRVPLAKRCFLEPEDDEMRHSREGGNPAMHHNYHFHFATRNELDLSNLCKMEDFFEGKRFDMIVNCAAYTAVDRAETDSFATDAINHRFVSMLAKIAKRDGSKLIHISTDYVFNGRNHRPYVESDPTDPQGVYGRTKRDGENAILAAAPKNTLIIRTSWLYSSFGHNFVKTMLRTGRERDSLSVVFDQVGTPTYARDLAQAILDILPRIRNDAPVIYHYSNEGVTSWYDFAEAVFELGKIECALYPITTDQYPTPAQRPHYSVLDKTKIKNDFNLSIPYWRDSLRECLKELEEKK